MDKKKPIILIIDRPRPRSPLLTQCYNYISRPNGPFNVIIDGRVDTPAEIVIKDRLKDVKPDYIYWGFTKGASIGKSAKYINSNNISTIVDIGDIECFVSGGVYGENNLKDIRVKFVIARWKETKNYRTLHTLTSYINKKMWLKGAKIIYIPPGIDSNIYKDRKLKRDIDVSLICTIERHKYHTVRRMIKDVLNKMKNRMENRINIKIGNVWGDEYIDALFRSKIFIVEGSNRNAMGQKYLEGSACGAMLLGEIPFTAKDIFVDKVSIVDVEDYSKIDEQIMYYLKYSDEREKIAKEGQNRIFGCCTLDKVVKNFEETIIKDYQRNS